MEKLSIREASERFGLSRARLYQLLDKGAIAGHRSKKGKTWLDSDSLYIHIENREKKQLVGRPITNIIDGDFLPVSLAAKRTGYTPQHINLLARQGSIAAKKLNGVRVVSYEDLLRHKRTY
ncbi:MAG: hypothetical protein ABFS56_34035 [Pseudomonadota bacterium]